MAETAARQTRDMAALLCLLYCGSRCPPPHLGTLIGACFFFNPSAACRDSAREEGAGKYD